MIKNDKYVKISQNEALERAKNSIDNLLDIVKANDKYPVISPVIEEKTTETIENLAIIQRYLIGYYDYKRVVYDLMQTLKLADNKQEYAISAQLQEIVQKITEGDEVQG